MPLEVSQTVMSCFSFSSTSNTQNWDSAISNNKEGKEGFGKEAGEKRVGKWVEDEKREEKWGKNQDAVRNKYARNCQTGAAWRSGSTPRPGPAPGGGASGCIQACGIHP
jgi:hypothetical protein